ncbi:hypothetical protein B0H63DRAFT_560425 [Podospora didyma]|uniref:Uncharacterized protein n=1 Tax=Podospora didyma TaxID=330526 RepID=A0AAE0NQS7_9PEZI|nr:hypothetical protein B0H63DRAFT_560425 [Podospora didyma]
MTITGMLRARAGPLLFASAIGGGLWWQTAGGKQQPASRAYADPSKSMHISETLQSLSSQGGPHARKTQHIDHDPKDTKIYSVSPDAATKKNVDKVRWDVSEHGRDGKQNWNIPESSSSFRGSRILTSERMRDKASSAVDELKDNASSATESMKNKASSATESMKNTINNNNNNNNNNNIGTRDDYYDTLEKYRDAREYEIPARHAINSVKDTLGGRVGSNSSTRSRNESAGRYDGTEGGVMDRTAGSMAEDMKDRASSASEGIKRRASSTAESIKDSASSTAQGMKERASSAAEGMMDSASSAAQGMRQRAGSAADGFKDTANSATESVKDTFPGTSLGRRPGMDSDRAAGSLDRTAGSITDGIKDKATSVKETAASAKDKISDKMTMKREPGIDSTRAAGSLDRTAGLITEGIKETATSAKDKISSAVGIGSHRDQGSHGDRMGNREDDDLLVKKTTITTTTKKAKDN